LDQGIVNDEERDQNERGEEEQQTEGHIEIHQNRNRSYFRCATSGETFESQSIACLLVKSRNVKNVPSSPAVLAFDRNTLAYFILSFPYSFAFGKLEQSNM
jgi:hypothetical protein